MAYSYSCSQESHEDNCGHFGHTGAYLSEHDDTCPIEKREGPCDCNPKARAKRALAKGAMAEPLPTNSKNIRDSDLFEVIAAAADARPRRGDDFVEYNTIFQLVNQAGAALYGLRRLRDKGLISDDKIAELNARMN